MDSSNFVRLIPKLKIWSQWTQTGCQIVLQNFYINFQGVEITNFIAPGWVGIVIQFNKKSNVIILIFISMITSKCLVNAISLPPFAYRFWKIQ